MKKRIVIKNHSMCLIFVLSCLLVTSYETSGLSQEHNGHTTEDAKKADDDASASNSSYYSTREMRDMVLKEWAGKTQEVQEYFDQLPSEEFKENSEALKLMHYYEKKGLDNIDSKQIFNITPQVRVSTGLEYTIEVNDSYVPKYRVSTSEEINMEKYGTFNSKPDEDSYEEDVGVVSETSVTTEPPDSEGEKPGGKKKKKRRPKKWPPNMDPKEKVKRKKKKRTPKDETKRKEMIKNKINNLNINNLKMGKNKKEIGRLNKLHTNYHIGVMGINRKMNNIGFEEAYKKNIENVISKKREHDYNVNKLHYMDIKCKEKGKMSSIKRRKYNSIYNSYVCKLNHKLKDLSHNHRNLSRSSRRSFRNIQYPQPLF